MRLSTYLRVAAAVLLASPMATAQSGLQNSTLDRTSSATVIANGGMFKPAEATTPVTGSNGGASALDLTEGFDSFTAAIAAGWAQQNRSSPVGTTTWRQGAGGTTFPGNSGGDVSYAAANFNSTGAVGTISDWLLTPQTALQNGTTLRFFTRTVTGAQFPDRMEIRMSTAGASVNVGTSATSVGDFTTLLLTINPTLASGPTGYPDVWTEFTATVSGLAAPTNGRFAFRYSVDDGGANGANSNYIGLDDVRIVVGTVAGPALSANPTSLAFGTAVTVGQPSAPRTVTLTNGGTAATTVTGITSSNAAFTVTAPAFPLTIAASGTATFTVRFTPTNTTAQTGNILVASNAPGSPLTIAVTGTGNADVTSTIPPGTTIGGPTFNRSNTVGTGASGSCTLSTTVVTVAYRARQFTIATAGNYTITTDFSGTAGYDGFIFLYRTSFAPADPCLNLVALDDDFLLPPNTSALQAAQIAGQALTAGTYVLVVTGFGNGSAGTFAGTVVGPSAAIFAVAGEGTASNGRASLSAAPNPFQGTATVRFTTATAQDVTVSVYDVTGRQVATLFAGAVAADQEVAASLDGSQLPSGVYVIRATGSDLNLTQRVTVVR